MRITLPLLILLFFFASSELFAQGLCNNGTGAFSVAPAQGCAPLSVKITSEITDAIDLQYNLDYRGQANPGYSGTLTSTVFSSAGVYTILQKAFRSNGTITYKCNQVTVYETRAITAQYTSCGGGDITITIQAGTITNAYDEFEVDWGDGRKETLGKGVLTAQHNYTNTSSSPTVLITGLYAGGKSCSQGRTASLPISFQQNQLGDIAIKSLEMRGDGSLRVTYQGVVAIPTDIKYSLDGTSYTTAGQRSSGGIQPFDIKSLNVNQVYSIKLSSQDLCNNPRDSKVISSMTLSGKSDEGKNVLTWSKYGDPDGFTGYDLIKDGTVIESFTSIDDVTYTDEDVECGSYSDYQIVAEIGDVTSTSAPVGVRTEITSPKPISEASVSVVANNAVTINAKVPGSGGNSTFSMSVERAEAGTSVFKKLITLYNQSEYTDVTAKTDELSYCYRMSYENSCGQKLPASEPICTILLSKNLTTLNWTGEPPMLSEIEGYDVLQTGTSGSAQEIPVQMNTSYTVKLNAQSDLEYNFQIRATSQDGNFESLSNIINYRRNAGVFVPDAFTPNGDGYNDILEAKSTQLQSFNFSVLNRWGEVVFHSDNIDNGWDGTINGANAPVGYYVYKMTFVDDINQTVEKSGTFMLLR